MKPDLKTLRRLSLASPSRNQLRDQGFHCMHAYADLHPHGYSIRVWFHLKRKAVAYEYHAVVRNRVSSGLPRIVATDYQTQCALHRALGLCVVAPDKAWSDNPLFAGLECG